MQGIVDCGSIVRATIGSQRNGVEPWLPLDFEQRQQFEGEWTTSGESLHGAGFTDNGGTLFDGNEAPYWFVGTALPW